MCILPNQKTLRTLLSEVASRTLIPFTAAAPSHSGEPTLAVFMNEEYGRYGRRQKRGER
jgi:hypothetical protein